MSVSRSGLHRSSEAPIDEAALIEKARVGDREARETLARLYLGDVYGLAFRILGERDLAEDATQEAMINALNGLSRFRGDASFRTWLLRITANSAKSLGRKRWRKREVAITLVEQTASDEPDPEEVTTVRAEAERVMELLARLPPKQKMAVHLRVSQGLSYAEIGEIIGCSEGAARVNYHLGIKRLREMTE